MRNPLSKVITEIEPSGIRKFFDLVVEMNDPNVISLGVGEPDFDTPWHIREEGIYSLEKGRTFYTSNAGLKELKEEISAYLERKCHVEYDPVNEIMVTVGGSEAIDIAMRAMLNPGEEVIIPQPSYVSYQPCVVLADGVPVIINLQEKNEFKLTAAELEAAITPKTKILVLPFPNNPTGSIMTEEDLKPIAELCVKHDIFVISDEIYSELTYEYPHTSIASLPGMKERTVLINGFSKAYAMTGWRLGYACAPDVILHQMLKIHQFAIMCAPTISQYAGVEALKNGDEDVAVMREAYNERRRYVLHRFHQMGLEMNGISQGLLNAGNMISRYSAVFLILAVLLIGCILFFSLTEKGHAKLRKLVTHLPVFCEIPVAMDYSRLAQGLSLGLRSGLSPETSLELTEAMLTQPEILEKLRKTSELLNNGEAFSKALTESELFSGMEGRLISISFYSGTSDETFRRLSQQYTEKSIDLISQAVSVVEPTIVILLSLLVGLVLLSVMMPLLGILSDFAI